MQVPNVHALVRALSRKNDARKGCAMQLNETTLKCKNTNLSYLLCFFLIFLLWLNLEANFIATEHC